MSKTYTSEEDLVLLDLVQRHDPLQTRRECDEAAVLEGPRDSSVTVAHGAGFTPTTASSPCEDGHQGPWKPPPQRIALRL